MRTCRHCGVTDTDAPFVTRNRKTKAGQVIRETRNVCKACWRKQAAKANGKTTTVYCPHCQTHRETTKRGLSRERLCRKCRSGHFQNGAANASWGGTANIPLEMFHHWQRNATANGRAYAFELVIEDVQRLYDAQSGKCALTGRVLDTKRNSPDRMSLDRIDNAIGYVVGNVHLTTYQANVAKHRHSTAELVRLASDVIRANCPTLDDYLAAVSQPSLA